MESAGVGPLAAFTGAAGTSGSAGAQAASAASTRAAGRRGTRSGSEGTWETRGRTSRVRTLAGRSTDPPRSRALPAVSVPSLNALRVLLALTLALAACGPRSVYVGDPGIGAGRVIGVEHAKAPTATVDRTTYTAGDTVAVGVENRTAGVVRVALGAGQIERRVGGRWERWADVCPALAGADQAGCLDPAPRVVRDVAHGRDGYRFRVPPSAPPGTYRYAVAVTRSTPGDGLPDGGPVRRERLATGPFEVIAPEGALVVPRFTPDPERFYPEMFVAGRLVREGPCLRLDVGEPASYVVVWPAGTTASAAPDGRSAARLATGLVAAEGDLVTGGGGFGGGRDAPVRPSEEYEVQVPAACPGPLVVLVPVTHAVPTGPVDPAATGGLYFPRRAGPGPSASARLGGRLVRRDSCLYVEAEGWDETYLVVWPVGAVLETDGSVRVRDLRDVRGEAAVAVGDRVVLGGREAGREEDGDLDAPLPGACPGPVWRAGSFEPRVSG